MKLRLGLVCIIALLFSLCAPAQDSIRLTCPLNDAVVVPPAKNAIQYDPPDLCIVLTSKPDTTVKAVINATVTNVEVDDEGKYGVVLFARFKNKDYYFWYTGLSRAIVSRGNVVKAGQALGYIKPGERVELAMYDFETPVDPLRYMSCKEVLKAF